MKKILPIMVLGILFVSGLGTVVSAEEPTELEIDLVVLKGDIVMLVTNIGSHTAINVEVSLDVSKIFGFGTLDITDEATIDYNMVAGGEYYGAFADLSGIGLVSITAVAEASNAPRVEKTATGLVILPIVIIL
jgi:hypothetical protein